MRVVVGGATGKLGGLVARLITEREDMELVGAVVSPDSDRLGTELFPGIEAASPHDLTSLLSGADVYVDLTSPSAAESNLPSVPEGGVNAVVGTTGISEETMQTFSQGISEKGLSAVVSPNFSVGVNLLWGLCDLLSRVLKDYDVEIIETHHNQKRDAPSGTAARAARIISEG
ncbi:MAG: 4-hydroxy-tetrahydrodipicolinate reductase, partial [Methanomassiliicoccales archaeon]